jgi:peptide/nickel transport system ATP-binding protein
MTPLVRLHDLSVTYPRTSRPALDRVTLDLMQGEKLAVIGESGSGKSTLARALLDLLPPGTRRAGRLDWTDSPPQPGRDVGYVFQDPGASLNPVLSIGAQLVEVLRTHLPLTRRAAKTRAIDLLDRVRIPDPALAVAGFPHQFSGGQRQRIAIALAIAAGPKLLIADEPTSALDMVVQAEIVALLTRLVDEDGMTLLFITHDIALASGLADRVAVFHDARLVETGAAAQVIGAPQADYTRTLVATHIDLETPVLIGSAP